MNGRIYLDYNATTPLAPEVAAALRPHLIDLSGNPSSLHWAGVPARDAVETARSQVAALLCCDATELIFTSGGTEANNHVLKGVFFGQQAKRKRAHIVTTQIEHPSILEPCGFLKSIGAEITYLPVDRFGRVDPNDVKGSLRAETVLISVMHANNETGTIQPIAEIASIARRHGVLFHSDAAQSAGKISVDVETLGVDLLSIAGHKLYAPKGVGALYVREGVSLTPLLHGATHEANRRAGTENVASIVGLGAACELAVRSPMTDDVMRMRDHLWSKLQQTFGSSVELNGHPTERLPNTLNVSFAGYLGGDVLAAMPKVAASTGSACHAGSHQISSVLQAMGTPWEIGLGALRFSVGRGNAYVEMDEVAAELRNAIDELQHRRGATNVSQRVASQPTKFSHPHEEY